MLQRTTFCVGDSGADLEAALALGVPFELQLATSWLLCRLKSLSWMIRLVQACENHDFNAAVASVYYLVEAQVHRSIMLDEDIESLHLPTKYRNAPQSVRRLFHANLEAHCLSQKFGWRLPMQT